MGDDPVDQPPAPGPLTAGTLRLGAEDVNQVGANTTLVDEPDEPTGCRKLPHHGHLGQGHCGAAVVDEKDLIGGHGELVARPGGRAVERGQPPLPGIGAGVFDVAPDFVGERGDAGSAGRRRSRRLPVADLGAEGVLRGAHHHHRPDLGVFEAQALHGVGEFDVHPQEPAEPEVVGGLTVFGDVEGQDRDRGLDRERPVPVALGGGVIGDHGRGPPVLRRLGKRHPWS